MTAMLFHHETASDDHIAVAHHRLSRAELSPDLSAFVLWVESWPGEAARLDGRAAVARWHLVVPAAGLPLESGLPAAIEAAALASPQFTGATPIPDASTSLEAAQARKWAEIKADRASRERGTFDWDGHSYDVDEMRLTGATVDAMAAEQEDEPYAQPWVLADNSVRTLNAAEQIALGRACKAYIADLWTVSQMLRAEIYAATTPQDVQAISWPA